MWRNDIYILIQLRLKPHIFIKKDLYYFKIEIIIILK